MVPVITRGVSNYEFLQPLDTASSNLAGYHGSQWTAVIWSQVFTVHLVREHNSPIAIHDPVEFDGCSIVTVRLYIIC